MMSSWAPIDETLAVHVRQIIASACLTATTPEQFLVIDGFACCAVVIGALSKEDAATTLENIKRMGMQAVQALSRGSEDNER